MRRWFENQRLSALTHVIIVLIDVFVVYNICI
jgi:hypothetical protein